MKPPVWIILPNDLYGDLLPHAEKMGVTGQEYAAFLLRRCISALEAEKKQTLTALPEPKVLKWRRDRIHNG